MAIGFTTRQMAYGTIGISILVFLIMATLPAGSTLQFLFAGISLFTAVLAFLIWKYGYWVIPYITKRLNIIEVHDGLWETTPAQDAIIKKVGDEYYASVFLHIKMYKSTTERSAEENMVFIDTFERAIANIKYPVKISTLLYAKDIAKYREDVETKKFEAQLKLQREREKTEPDVLALDRLEKEVAMYEAELNRIISGERPMGLIAYAMTTGVGVTKDAAVAVAKNQAAEIKTLLANALNVEVSYLYGEDMKKCYALEFMVPPTIKALKEFVED
ncbi:MAG: hypothetical protein NZ903_01975 [Candidatus Micrarchaeota archaeon]|nr:hypothetical protein [Candidatus Micrarchaeota archaeon]